MTETREIILPEQANGAVVPINVDSLVAMVDAFDKFKSKVLKDDDFWVDTRNDNKRRVKKSGWLKYALACNLNLEKVEEREIDKEMPPGSGDWVTIFHFDYRAIAQSGRFAEASGSASTAEREGSDKMIHDTRSLAQTRATNRAISNLVGGGEVSAEEMQGSSRRQVESNQKTVKKTPKTKKQAKPEVKPELKLKPEVKDDEARVTTFLEANGLSTDHCMVYKYKDVIRIAIDDDFPPEKFEEYNEALKLIKAKWLKVDNCWESPIDG
ncbi:hypothetical protein LCGC14_2511150 [marine sediment metagenome]|uniref:Uncharacterized protein n=1 Tax=marine sediment metagenome TaxID=412755 RepID=A0A0F9BLZ5_9ZZZZ